MNTLRLLPIIVLLPILFSSCTPEPESLRQACIRCEVYQHDGRERTYVLHVPDDLPSQAPLLFFLHGYGGQAHQYAWFFQMRQWADENGFALVVPQGSRDLAGEYFWNARLSIGDIDDIGFLSGLAQELQQTHDLSPENTFTAGISNGGFMSYTLIAERPEIFKAAASLIGTMSGHTWQNREEIPSTPILQLSLIQDETVPIDGSMSTDGGWGGAPHMDTVIEFWTQLNETTEVQRLTPNDHTVGLRYIGGPQGHDVWYYTVDGFPHDVPRNGWDGTDPYPLIWEFFQQYITN